MPSTPSSTTTARLAQLAAITGSEYNHERALIAVQNAVKRDGDSLSKLVAAAAEVYMHVTPVRLPLAEVVWRAHHDMPVVVWSAKESRWIVITFAGWFRVRIADGEHPTHRITLSRGELVQLLGLQSVNDVVEAGIVHPERPAHDMSVHAAVAQEVHTHGAEHGNSHGHGHAAQVSPARRFFRLLKAERGDIVTLLIFSVFAGLLYLAAPLAVDAVVSNLAFGGQSQPYVQAIVILAFALFGALALQAVVSGFQYYISDIIQRRIFVRTAADLAYRLPRVKAEALDDVHAPELVNRFLDVVTAQKSTSLLLLDGINLVFGSLIGMLLLALYHPVLLLFVGVLLVLIIVITWLLGRGAVDTSIAESRMKYDVVNWFEEIAAFPFLFKGPGGYDLAYERANQLATEYLTRRASHFRIVMRQIVGLLVVSVLASATLLVVGGWLVVSQQITLGQLVASELIMGSIVASLAKMGKKLEAWYDAMAAMDKLGHIFDLEIEREDGEQPVKREGGAEVRGCELAFGYHATLFEKKTFTIPSGSRAAIVGPHGSGASSLLDILFGLRQPVEGHVSIDGLDLRSWYLEALRESVMLLRRDEIVDGSVIENLRLGRVDVGLDEIRGALERVGLLDVLLHRPEGLNLRLKVGGAPLSGNQRTRLLLARALVQRPRLLLIDELFDSLDDESFKLLETAILDPSLTWTVILATRDHDVTKRCDQIIELAPCHLNDGTSSQSETQRLQNRS
jgi:ABC-type bacteriocin/lantibiotic exporter with double-glycine peptidase domain